MDSSSHAVDSGFQVLNSGFQSSVGSRFQRPGFPTPQAKIFRTPNSTSKSFSHFGILSYMGRHRLIAGDTFPNLWTTLFKAVTNRPFPSSRRPLFQNEGRCSAFDMEIMQAINNYWMSKFMIMYLWQVIDLSQRPFFIQLVPDIVSCTVIILRE